MPSVLTMAGVAHPAPLALALVLLAAVAYLVGVRAVARRGGRWPWWRTAAFLVLGLGSYAWVECGVLGTWATELRWAFTTRVALLLVVVPGLVMTGRPVGLAAAALPPRAAATVTRVVSSRPARLVGNAIVAPLVALAAFLVLLTPVAGALRISGAAETGIGVVVPALGLALVAPMAETGIVLSSLAITAEFLIAFVELVMDAIPGILMRLSGTVLDGVTTALPHAATGWWPSPLRDQQLAGDVLWFLAEVADVPVLIALFLRWLKADRAESTRFDELDDEEMGRLLAEHLRRRA